MIRAMVVLAVLAALPHAAQAQTETASVVGRTCIGLYNVSGYQGTILVRFLASDQPGTVRVERHRITDANRAKLAQAHGGTYDVSSPDTVRLEDFELLRAHLAKIVHSQA